MRRTLAVLPPLIAMLGLAAMDVAPQAQVQTAAPPNAAPAAVDPALLRSWRGATSGRIAPAARRR